MSFHPARDDYGYSDWPQFAADEDAGDATGEPFNTVALLAECRGQLEGGHEAARLEAALISACRIGAAIGVLMARQELTDHEAFALLRSVSRERDIELRVVADAVVQTGDVPF